MNDAWSMNIEALKRVEKGEENYVFSLVRKQPGKPAFFHHAVRLKNQELPTDIVDLAVSILRLAHQQVAEIFANTIAPIHVDLSYAEFLHELKARKDRLDRQDRELALQGERKLCQKQAKAPRRKKSGSPDSLDPSTINTENKSDL